MAFFNRKKEEAKPCCCLGTAQTAKYDAVLSEVTSVKVLGAGCKSCHQMYENKVMQYGAMSMPVLVINEKVVSAGKVLKPQETVKLLSR